MKSTLQTIADGKGVLIPDDFLQQLGITEAVDIRLENNRIIIQSPKTEKSRAKGFVEFVLKLCNSEKTGAKAALKAADNPNRQDKSYDYLAPFFYGQNIQDLENQTEYSAYVTIAAAIAKAKIEQNGDKGIGTVIGLCYDIVKTNEGSSDLDPQAKTKMRRLLACDSTDEACRVLRPLFSLIESKGLAHKVDYIKLLSDLEKFQFDNNRESIKQRWARDFYRRLRLSDKDKDDE